jgi:7-cyano-7-deazaguanine reductase
MKLLGHKTQYPKKYDPSILEKIPFNSTTLSWASFICNEFTNLCPVTQQPDFAKIYINYIPNGHLLESKSLKIYLFSFRNHPCFHETTVNTVASDIFRAIRPHFIEVIGKFLPRGGISIHPYTSLSSRKFEKFRQERFAKYGYGINSQ